MPNDDDLCRLYQESVGRPPRNLHEGDPDWEYRGTKEDREAMLDRHRLRVDTGSEDQTSLFGE